MKVLLYFGSFNPVHMGHLAIADHAALYAGVNKVWFVVSPQNPFKSLNKLAHEHDRYEMVRQAIYGNTRLDVNDIEFRLPKPSYTSATLYMLRQNYPDYEFSLLIGQDNLPGFSKWKDYENILVNHNLVIYPRSSPEQADNSLPEWAVPFSKKIIHLNGPLLNISSTLLRKRIKEGKPLTYLVPEVVESYINANKLYL